MHLCIFGYGFSSRAIGRRLGNSVTISATGRSDESLARIRGDGHRALRFDGETGLEGAIPGDMTHLLISVPPTNPKDHAPDRSTAADPVLHHLSGELGRAEKLEWVGYLSTVGIYGDHQGRWVDEETPPSPASERSRRRVVAEDAWRAFAAASGVRLQIFRLAGIYGPGRNPIASLKKGRSRMIIKPGQVFNRIHVEDIATTVLAGMAHKGTQVIFNVTDDEPAPPDEVMAFAAKLAGLTLPPAVPFDEADLSPMARSFYGECKRVSNARIKGSLGVRLKYPNYREGLRDIVANYPA